MTFTTRLKEEISKLKDNEMESRSILDAFLRYNASINKNSIVITLENASVARYIYKIIKELFQINPKVTVRIQKRFRVKQIYILEHYYPYCINQLKLNYLVRDRFLKLRNIFPY